MYVLTNIFVFFEGELLLISSSKFTVITAALLLVDDWLQTSSFKLFLKASSSYASSIGELRLRDKPQEKLFLMSCCPFIFKLPFILNKHHVFPQREHLRTAASLLLRNLWSVAAVALFLWLLTWKNRSLFQSILLFHKESQMKGNVDHQGTTDMTLSAELI